MSILCISVHFIALMVGFDQSAYEFDEDASTGQVCITFTGDLASTVTSRLGLILVEETAEGTCFLLYFGRSASLLLKKLTLCSLYT